MYCSSQILLPLRSYRRIRLLDLFEDRRVEDAQSADVCGVVDFVAGQSLARRPLPVLDVRVRLTAIAPRCLKDIQQRVGVPRPCFDRDAEETVLEEAILDRGEF